MTVGAKEGPWPKNYMVVGTMGGSDYWFIEYCNQKRVYGFGVIKRTELKHTTQVLKLIY